MNQSSIESKPIINYETLSKSIIRPPKDEYDETVLLYPTFT